MGVGKDLWNQLETLVNKQDVSGMASFYASDAVEQECGCIEKAWGRNAEVYRCETCKTLYLPNPEAANGINVAGEGQISVFGLTLPPKEEKK